MALEALVAVPNGSVRVLPYHTRRGAGAEVAACPAMFRIFGGSPGAAGALFAESLDLARRMGMKRHTAYALIGLALAGRGGAGPGWSARLNGAADQALADLGETIEPLEGRLADLDRQRLRAAMGAEAFDA